MKKQLLFAVVSLLTFSAANAGSFMDGILKCLWMNTDVAPLATDARQAVAKDGKFYLQNHTTGKIEIWNETGKIDEIVTGPSTNIGLDDAGNIVVRTGTFPSAPSSSGDGVKIISNDFKTVKTISLTGLIAGRADFYGHIPGDVLSATGGYLYSGGNWVGNFAEVPIVNGEQDKTNTYSYNFSGYVNSNIKVDGTFTTTHQISAYNFMPDTLALLSPNYQKTGISSGFGNSIYCLGYDAEYNWVPKGFFITPNHNGASGYQFFECDGNKYVIYSSGSNIADGFSIARVAVKNTPANEDTDANYRVASKYAETKDDGSGTPLYTNNAFFGNHFNVEPSTEAHKVYIYQYFPSGYIAKYELDLTAYANTTSVITSKETENRVHGIKGAVVVEGEGTAKVYTLTGAFAAEGKGVISVASGIYIVKVGNETSKVVVK